MPTPKYFQLQVHQPGNSQPVSHFSEVNSNSPKELRIMKYVTYEGDTFRDTFLKHLEVSLLAIYEFNENRAQKTEYHEGMGERFRT